MLHLLRQPQRQPFAHGDARQPAIDFVLSDEARLGRGQRAGQRRPLQRVQRKMQISWDRAAILPVQPHADFIARARETAVHAHALQLKVAFVPRNPQRRSRQRFFNIRQNPEIDCLTGKRERPRERHDPGQPAPCPPRQPLLREEQQPAQRQRHPHDLEDFLEDQPLLRVVTDPLPAFFGRPAPGLQRHMLYHDPAEARHRQAEENQGKRSPELAVSLTPYKQCCQCQSAAAADIQPPPQMQPVQVQVRSKLPDVFVNLEKFVEAQKQKRAARRQQKSPALPAPLAQQRRDNQRSDARHQQLGAREHRARRVFRVDVGEPFVQRPPVVAQT